MPLNYYIYLIILSFIIVFLACSFLWRRKNVPVELFTEALKDENSGHYEEAVIHYESALSEVNKVRFHSTLRNKISEKLKVLHTLIKYKNNFHPGNVSMIINPSF